ncbi:MAG: hypothetical protein ACLPWD_05840 [Methanobacterium sp.]
MEDEPVFENDYVDISRIGNIQLEDDLNSLYIHNKFIDVKTNINGDFCLPYNSDYFKQNYIQQACLYSIIIDTYKSSFDSRYPSFKMDYLNLYNYINNTKKIDTKTLSFASSLNQWTKFFDQFSIEVVVINALNKIVYIYTPSKIINVDKNISHKLYLLYYNNHVFKISNYQQFNASFDYLVKEQFNNELSFADFYLAPSNSYDYYIYHGIDQINEIKANPLKKHTYLIDFSHKLSEIFVEIMNKLKYIPRIQFKNGFTDSLTMSFNKDCMITIQNDIKSGNYDKIIETYDLAIMNIHNNFNKHRTIIGQYLMNKQTISNYSSNFRHWISYYRIDIPYGKLSNFNRDKVIELDLKKAYTSCLLDIDYIPIFNNFCQPLKYDNHSIEDLTLYLIKICEFSIIFNLEYTLIYGFNLKKINIKHNIIEYTRPSSIIKNTVHPLIQNLYDDTSLDINDKKNTINYLIGKIGKRINKQQTGIYCSTLENAQKLQMSSDGYIMPIKDECSANINGYYFINSIKKSLLNGFMPLRNLILDIARMKMYDLSTILTNQKYSIVAYKTDALYYLKQQIEPKIAPFTYIDSNNDGFEYIGRIKQSNHISDGLFDASITTKTNNVIYTDFKSTPIIYENLSFVDESKPDMNLIKSGTIISSPYPGCGKSYTCMEYMKFMNVPTLIVVFNGALINDIKSKVNNDNVNVITSNNMFGFDIDGNIYKQPHALDNYKLVIFEEIYLNNDLVYELMNTCINNNPNVTFIANGDPQQLTTDNTLDSTIKQQYIKQMFPRCITLKIIKRSENRQFYDIKKYIDENTDDDKTKINYIIDTWFKSKIITKISSNLQGLRGLTYKNATKNYLNNKIHYNLCSKSNKPDYHKGLILVALHYIVIGKSILHNNFMYEITDIQNDLFTLKCTSSDEVFIFTKKIIEEHFTFNHIKTFHSQQGFTYDFPYTIYESDFHRTNIYAFWVAITRATRFENIYIYKGPLPNLY